MTYNIVRRSMRKTRILLLLSLTVILFGTFFLAVSDVQAQSVLQYPSDLTIVAFSGGPAPWERLEKIEINSSGYSTYWLMTNRTTAEWVLNATFILSADNMTTIWNAIQANNFFSLASNYTDPAWMDGSYCNITITAGGQTHSVYTQNIKVPEFDAIAVTINNVTPGDLDLFYNEIHPEIDPPMIVAATVGTPKEANTTFYSFSAFLFIPLILGTSFLCFQGVRKEVQKLRQRSLSRYIRLYASILMLLILVALIVDNVAADGTKVTWTQCKIKVKIELEFWSKTIAEADLKKLAAKWKKGIEDTWGGFKYKGCTVTFDVNTKIRKETDPKTKNYHQIQVVKGPNRSNAYKQKFDPQNRKNRSNV